MMCDTERDPCDSSRSHSRMRSPACDRAHALQRSPVDRHSLDSRPRSKEPIQASVVVGGTRHFPSSRIGARASSANKQVQLLCNTEATISKASAMTCHHGRHTRPATAGGGRSPEGPGGASPLVRRRVPNEACSDPSSDRKQGGEVMAASRLLASAGHCCGSGARTRRWSHDAWKACVMARRQALSTPCVDQARPHTTDRRPTLQPLADTCSREEAVSGPSGGAFVVPLACGKTSGQPPRRVCTTLCAPELPDRRHVLQQCRVPEARRPRDLQFGGLEPQPKHFFRLFKGKPRSAFSEGPAEVVSSILIPLEPFWHTKTLLPQPPQRVGICSIFTPKNATDSGAGGANRAHLASSCG
jgi:hypothetical protein